MGEIRYDHEIFCCGILIFTVSVTPKYMSHDIIHFEGRGSLYRNGMQHYAARTRKHAPEPPLQSVDQFRILDLDAVGITSSTVVWRDSSPFENHVTLYNTAYDTSHGAPGILFDGMNSFGHLSFLHGFDSDYFTLIVWVYCRPDYNGVLAGLSRSSADANTEFVVYMDRVWDYDADTPDGELGSYGIRDFVPVVKITEDGWNQIAITKDALKWTWYLNGRHNGSTISSKRCYYSNNDFCIGKDYRDNTYSLNGTINKLEVFNKALTPSHILADFVLNKSRFLDT